MKVANFIAGKKLVEKSLRTTKCQDTQSILYKVLETGEPYYPLLNLYKDGGSLKGRKDLIPY